VAREAPCHPCSQSSSIFGQSSSLLEAADCSLLTSMFTPFISPAALSVLSKPLVLCKLPVTMPDCQSSSAPSATAGQPACHAPS